MSRPMQWRAQVRPGRPVDLSPLPRSTSPAPTVYPESSISNPDYIRYAPRRGRSSSLNSSPPPQPQHSPPSRNYYSSRAPQAAHSAAARIPPHRSPVYHDLYTDGAIRVKQVIQPNGRPGQLYIQAPGNSNIQVIRPRRSETTPPSYTRNAPHRHSSPTSERSLFRRVLDKFSTNNKYNDHTRTRSSSAYPPSTKQYSVQSSSSTRQRRNSTGDHNKWHVVPGKPVYVSHSNSNTRHGQRYRVIDY